MTAQTDVVWPIVWSVEGLAITYSFADVAERRPHSTAIVQTLRMEKEIGREAVRQTDRQKDRHLLPLCFQIKCLDLVLKRNKLFPLRSAVT